MPGTSAYPGGLDNFAAASPTNLGDNDATGRTHSERHDDVEAAVEAVQAELGTDPAGASATVKARFEALDSSLAAKTDDVDLPHTANIPGVVLPNASSGLNTQAYAGACYFNCLAYTNNTQDCYLEWAVFLAAGTYTLRTLHRSNTDYGILSISVDGGAALGTTVDGYAASVTSNNITDITGVSLTAGRHTIRYTAATKNASSTGYRIGIHGITLTRTGA